MTELAGKIISYIFSITENLGATIIIVASIMFLLKRLINFMNKTFSEIKVQVRPLISSCIKDEKIDKKAFDNICNAIFKVAIKPKPLLAIASNIVYIVLSISMFFAIIGVKDYIPGVEEGTTYSFLFIDNILQGTTNILLPVICTLFMLISKNIKNIKAVFTHVASSCFLAAFLIFTLSLYSAAFGIIYLIYIITFSILNLLFTCLSLLKQNNRNI